MKKLFVITALMLAAATFAAAQKLEAGKTFEREIGGAERHSYDVQMKKDEAYNLVVEQRGVDVVLRVYAPDGSLAADLDTPNGANGDESLVFAPTVSGNYRIEITAFKADAPKGKYFVKTVATRPATKAERAEAQLKNDLMTVNRALDDAGNRGDKAAFFRMMTDDYIVTGVLGTVAYKADAMKGFSDSKDTKNTDVYSNIQVRDYGDTALMSFIDDGTIQIGEQKVSFQMRVTEIFRRVNGQWMLAASHATDIKKVQDPPIVKLDAKILSEYAGEYELLPGVTHTIESDGEKLIFSGQGGGKQNRVVSDERRHFLLQRRHTAHNFCPRCQR